ncbi:leashin-like [Rosa sericea]
MAVEDLCPPSSEICTVPNSESPEPDVELGCSRKKKKNKKKRCKLESNDKSCESPSLQSQFVQLSDQEAPQPLTEKSTTITDSENPQSNVEPSLATKKKKKKKKKKKGSKTTETNDTSCESPSLQPQLVQLSDQQAPQPLAEKITTITDSENPQSNVEPSLSTKKKKKKKKGSKTTETNDTSCSSPSLQPQLVQLSDQQAPQPLAEKITTITDSESPQSNVELSLSQNKKKKKNKKNKKGCKTPGTNDKSCENPSIQPQLVQVTDQEVEVPQRIEAVQPQLAQVTDQKLEVPQPIEDSSFSVKNKKRNGKKSRKPHDCNDEVCGVSVGTSVMESNMPAVDPYIKPSVEISLEQLVAEPLVEGMSTTANSKSPKPNADFGCSQEMKKKKRKRSHKTNEYKELLVETMMPEADPSFQPSLAMFSEQELEVSQPLNVDAESLVEGMSTTINSERPRPNADFNCSQETKKKKRKRGRKTSDSKEVLVEPMLPEAESSLQPSLTMLSEQELDVAQPLNADAEPLVEGMSTTMNSGSPKPNADVSCSQETKKKNPKRKRKTCESKELLVEIMTPEADPSLQPLLAIFSEQEVEVPQPLNTDAQPLVKGVSTTNSESPKPNAEFSCSQETKKNNPKRKRKTNENKELLVEIMMPEADPSLQPLLAIFSEQEVEVAQPLNTGTVWKETEIDEVPSLSHLAPKADTEVVAIGREGNLSQKKLLILDINGLLADIVQMEVSIPNSFKPDKIISRKAVFKRPFCDDFLQFCFDRFNVGVWSSRTKENVDSVIDFLLGDSKHKLLFCWNQSHCTSTSFKTVENKNKPLVLKELRKLWEKLEPDLPWARGEYNESNTVLLDDSPYKALRNPVNTAIFPNSYQFRNRKDSSLGPGGDIRSYLEGLAMAESVQKYVEQNPFGQRPITKSNPSWNFYRRVIEDVKPLR